MLVVYSSIQLKPNWHEISGVVSGNYNTLSSMYPNNPEILEKYKEFFLPEDDLELMQNYRDYRIYNGKICLKPLVKLVLDNDTALVGETVNLTITVINLQENESIPSIDFYYDEFSDTEILENNMAVIPFSFNQPMRNIKFKVDGCLYRFVPVKLEVI